MKAKSVSEKIEMGNPSSETTHKTVLILGDHSLESVEDKIIASGYSFQTKLFSSEPFNWIEIEKDFKVLSSLEKLLTVFLVLSKRVLLEFSSSDYLGYWHDLLSEMKEYTSLIFIEEDSFQNKNFLTTGDELIKRCLDYINSTFKLIKELNLKYENGNFGEGFFNLNSIDKVSIEVSTHLVSLTSVRKKGHSTLSANLIKEDALTNDLLYKVVSLLSQINEIRKVMEHLDNLDTKGNPFVYLRSQEEKIELLIEHFQKVFQEKQKQQTKRAKHLLKLLQESGVEIVPYKENRDISLRVHHFLDEIDKGIFLHLYVPNGRYQEDQLASFLRLFESYLQRVENLQFFIETKKTLHGQIYEFKSKNIMMNMTDMEVAFSRFESFMSLCQNDQKKAEAFLLRTGIQPSEASRLMTKYVKEYQRLLLDIEHDRERKLLDLRHRLESEALELTYEPSLAVSQSTQPSALLSLSHNLDPLSITISNSSVVINPGIQSYVEQAIYGDIQYTTYDEELLHLFETYTEGLEAVRLRSDLEQLKDTSSSEMERKTAKQKIVGFLAKVAPSIGQGALNVLTAYLQKVLTGS